MLGIRGKGLRLGKRGRVTGRGWEKGGRVKVGEKGKGVLLGIRGKGLRVGGKGEGLRVGIRETV